MKRLTFLALVVVVSALGCRGPSNWSLSNLCLRNRGVECDPCAPPCVPMCEPSCEPMCEPGCDPIMVPGGSFDSSMVPLTSETLPPTMVPSP